MEQFLALIADYGTAVYVLLFLYCAFKSGLLPLFAGWAAQAGALDLSLVFLVTLLGGYLGDELRFVLARRFGPAIRRKYPGLQRNMEIASALFRKHGAAYIFLYRYPKGMRTIGALPVGLSGMAWGRFTRLNFLSALLWTALLTLAGYVFGAALSELAVAGWGPVSGVLLVVSAVIGFVLWRHARRAFDVGTGRADCASVLAGEGASRPLETDTHSRLTSESLRSLKRASS